MQCHQFFQAFDISCFQATDCDLYRGISGFDQFRLLKGLFIGIGQDEFGRAAADKQGGHFTPHVGARTGDQDPFSGNGAEKSGRQGKIKDVDIFFRSAFYIHPCFSAVDKAAEEQHQYRGDQKFEDDDGKGDEQALVDQVVADEIGQDKEEAAQDEDQDEPEGIGEAFVPYDAQVGADAGEKQHPDHPNTNKYLRYISNFRCRDGKVKPQQIGQPYSQDDDGGISEGEKIIRECAGQFIYDLGISALLYSADIIPSCFFTSTAFNKMMGCKVSQMLV